MSPVAFRLPILPDVVPAPCARSPPLAVSPPPWAGAFAMDENGPFFGGNETMRTSHLVLCTVLVGAAVASANAFLNPTPPRAASRRPLDPGEVQRLRDSGPETAGWRAQALEAVGVSSKLNRQQLDWFRQRGAEETYLLRYLAEYGVTPEESEALEAEGVQMALPDPTQMHAFHWAALADQVVLGQIQEVRGNPPGPYHTYIDFNVERHLKDSAGRRTERVTGVLLRSGPRYHAAGADTHEVEAYDEPELKPGERVVAFLSRRPLNLVSHLASTLANSGGRLPDTFEREYGTLGDLVRVLEAPKELEVVLAYKIVRDKAVLKSRALRAPGPYDVIDLSELTTRIERIAAAQERVHPGGRPS